MITSLIVKVTNQLIDKVAIRLKGMVDKLNKFKRERKPFNVETTV